MPIRQSSGGDVTSSVTFRAEQRGLLPALFNSSASFSAHQKLDSPDSLNRRDTSARHDNPMSVRCLGFPGRRRLELAHRTRRVSSVRQTFGVRCDITDAIDQKSAYEASRCVATHAQAQPSL